MSTVTIPQDSEGQILLILDTLEAVVNEVGPEYHYRKHAGVEGGCLYLHPETGEPDCIAARVLYRLGATKEQLGAREGQSCQSFLTDLPFTKAALMVLRYAQIAQDQDASWGWALDRARLGARTLGLKLDEDPA